LVAASLHSHRNHEVDRLWVCGFVFEVVRFVDGAEATAGGKLADEEARIEECSGIGRFLRAIGSARATVRSTPPARHARGVAFNERAAVFRAIFG
ncbi:MAG: hypothetical protein ACLPN5_01790, partial [Roseiarcus sp.]